jgi:GTPase SAR1 family protein
MPVNAYGNMLTVLTSESLREVPAEEAAQLAKERGLAWVETSAKDKNVNIVFEMCLKEIEKSLHPEEAAAAAAAAANAANGSANGAKDADKCIVM